jgi:hypothetical protein
MAGLDPAIHRKNHRDRVTLLRAANCLASLRLGGQIFFGWMGRVKPGHDDEWGAKARLDRRPG